MASSKFWVSWSHRLLLRRMWLLTIGIDSNGITELYLWLSDLEEWLRNTYAEVRSVVFFLSTAISWSWWQHWCTRSIYVSSYSDWLDVYCSSVFVSHLSIYMYLYRYCICNCWSLSYLLMPIFYFLSYPMEYSIHSITFKIVGILLQ